jgi:hypothetical protein
MAWRAGLSAAERAALEVWVARAMHDLVKYLEMMPRSLDWEALEEDDAEVLYDAVFRTRVERGKARGAREVWEGVWSSLEPGLRAKVPVKGEVDALLDELEGLVAPLERGGLEGVDAARLRAALFAVGDCVRGLEG